MLPDRVTQLLTAYVDGQLSPRHTRAVLRLLRKSPSARRLLRQLQQDREALRSLPRVSLGAHFPPKVLQALPDAPAPRRAPVTQPAAYPSWVGLATAAAVLLMVSVASFLYFSEAQRHQERAAVTPPDTRPDPTPASPPSPTVPVAGNQPPETPEGPAGPAPVPVRPAVAQRPAPPHPDANPDQPPGDDAVLAVPTPLVGLEMFQQVSDPGLALILDLHKLDQDKPRQRLREELLKDRSFRLELTCQDHTTGFRRLEAAFKAQGLRLVIDRDAQQRLKVGLKTNFVFYSESVTPGELQAVLRQAGDDDHRAEAGKRGDGQFGRVVVNRLTPADQKELAKLLGVDAAPAPGTRDVRKPVSEGTVDQVLKALKGQGPPRPEATAPAAPPTTERVVLVMAYNPVRPRPASREVKQFLDSRTTRRDGALQVLLVLRGNEM